MIVALLVCAGTALAQDPPRIAKYVPPAPDPRHVFVMDSAHVLSDSMIRVLQDSAQALQIETGADIAWVTLPTLGGRAIEEASVYLGRTWKIGSAGAPGDALRNRGLLILYVPNKAKTAGSNFRVEVGKGLQGTIIDSRSRSISAAMRDDLRAKRFDAGYMKGWRVAAAMVREDFTSQGAPARAKVAAVAATAPAGTSVNETGYAIVAVVLAVFLVVILVLIAIGKARRSGVLAAVASSSSGSSSSWSSSSSSSSSSSDSGSSGGSFGGGGGFDGGGSSDSI
jgi:uncharacterized protein